MLNILILVIALCIDTLLVAIIYSIKKIKVPVISQLIIAFNGAFFLCISLVLSRIIMLIIPSEICRIISITILLVIGIYTILQFKFKKYLKEHEELKFNIKNFNLVISIYADETKADIDKSKVLTAIEAFYLSLALSLDSLSSGIAYGLLISNKTIIIVTISCFILCYIFIIIGLKLGKYISKLIKYDLGWISGLLFIILAMLTL
ncbi:MAG: manganese efflux pump [Erysipelotrichaceae bacterium]